MLHHRSRIHHQHYNSNPLNYQRTEMADQIAEYEAQLAGIEELLQASPDDESLLTLKKDLVDLIALTKSDAEAAAAVIAAEMGSTEAPSIPPPPPLAEPPEPQATLEQAAEAGAAAASSAASEKPNKKKQKITINSEFKVPAHLIAKETDSEQEKNRKHKQLKKLKNKFRQEKKEAEHSHKQKSWQSFQKKANKRKDKDSIFSTQDTKKMTDFGARKRHKHEPL